MAATALFTHLALPGQQQSIHWPSLTEGGYALAIANAAQRFAGLTMAITADSQTALRLQAELDFFTAAADFDTLVFPDWETLPYDVFSPHQDIIAQRLTSLYRLPTLRNGILIVPVATLLQRLLPRSYLDSHTLLLSVGEQLDPNAFRLRLEAAGYSYVSQVMEHGEFTIRGSLLDLFPPSSEHPLRIDLFDDEIESIRQFDPETQRSIQQIKQIDLLPAREFPLTKEAISRFRQNFRSTFGGDPQRSPLYREVSNAAAPSGIEYYLPLFYDTTATLFDYLPDATLVTSLPGVTSAIDAFLEQVAERYEQRRHDIERPLLTPQALFLTAAQTAEHLAAYPQVELSTLADQDPPLITPLPEVAFTPRTAKPAATLHDFLTDFSGRVLFVAESSGRREVLIDTLRGYDLRPQQCASWHEFLNSDQQLALTVAPLEEGLILTEPELAIITEIQLYGQRVRQQHRRSSQRDVESIIRNLNDLELNAPVVHEEHGIGRYAGLQHLAVAGQESEFVVLEYAADHKLYVPVASLHLLSRYTGAAAEIAPLHKLGSDQWSRAKRKAAEKARDAAAELLDIYARREARPGYAFGLSEADYADFANAFPFQETPDQEAAIAAVINDLRADKPMDRIVCGDVGFGKTEVALRAAFIAVQDNRQVVVLVPTTLLAQQHYRNFIDRFADWPIRIEVLSRFRSKKQQDQVLAELAEGKLDILIGTHKVIQSSVKFKRLGLVIIDEEHRFGVRQKERLKALRTEVDILTLTATPIPRTLNMSLSGLRDLSIIVTPPAGRLAVKTFVGEWNDATIKEACQRELKRGGQIYFLHNEVESIERIANQVATLMPDARVATAHGQMRERQLEQVMLDFYHQRCNILVCTTIIESGIDVPNANTILINRADRLGLAQLHQLRGRVGRSHHRAYAYLIVPPRQSITKDAVKRIEAIESLEDLGAGFLLANHDLEIRGAGELLGEEQSGQIHEVGFSLYMDMLERAVNALKSGETIDLNQPLDHGPEIDLQIPALIPEDYLPDVHNRLILYKRIASAKNDEELKELQVEMIDRFGLLPEQVKSLFRITALKLQATPLGIKKIEAGGKGGRIVFKPDAAIDVGKLITLVQIKSTIYKLAGQEKLRFNKPLENSEARFQEIEQLLTRLTPN